MCTYASIKSGQRPFPGIFPLRALLTMDEFGEHTVLSVPVYEFTETPYLACVHRYIFVSLLLIINEIRFI